MAQCIFNSGTTPNYANTKWEILQKILCAIRASQSGGGSSGENLLGTGSPVGMITPDALGQFYTDTSVFPSFKWQAYGLTAADWVQQA